MTHKGYSSVTFSLLDHLTSAENPHTHVCVTLPKNPAYPPEGSKAGELALAWESYTQFPFALLSKTPKGREREGKWGEKRRTALSTRPGK